ncbi:MAG: M36 family metallopeptidase, partial [Actinomycetota bacterium]
MPVRTTRTLFALVVSLAIALSGLGAAPAAAAARETPRRAVSVPTSLDVRRPVASPAQLAAATARARAELGRSLGHQGVFQLDARTGTPRVVASLDGFLTGPSAAPPARVAMGYVRAHIDAFGLTASDLRSFVFLRDYVSVDGTHHLSWTQQAGGIRAFDNGLKANVTADGRLINLSGSPAHGLGVAGPDAHASLTAETAIARARADVGASTTSARGDTAQLVWFHGGRSRLAWQTFTNVSPDERDVSVVDATTGEVLWRANLVDTATGTGTAWEYSPSSAVTGVVADQQPVTFPVDSNAKLAGNNAHVYLDANDDNVPTSSDEVPSNGGLDWSSTAEINTTTTGQNCAPKHPCTWNKNVSKSWQTNRTQDAVQVYHYLNEFHDWLEQPSIGFNEAAGNFQRTNSSGKGEGGDAVQGQVFDGANTNRGLPDVRHYNNANFFTPPDGRAPVMQMYLFKADKYTPNWPSANAGDDASIVYHEYTHGLSNRLVTYPNGLQALNLAESGAMGEAWSDWYAMDYLVGDGSGTGAPGSDPSWIANTSAPGEVMVGKWITGG